METVGAMPASSLTLLTDSLLHRSQHAPATLPSGLKWAHAAIRPSMEMGRPVIALRKGPSYPQSLSGPSAPSSIATSVRTIDTMRTTAANTRGMYFFSASTMAVLPKPQAVSPPGIVPVSRAISTMRRHRKRMSRTPRTASENTTSCRSQVMSASSHTSLPPVLSIDSRLPPARAPPSNSSNMASRWRLLRIRTGRSKSRVSLGVRRISLRRPCFWYASSHSSCMMPTISMPSRGSSVISSSVSNSSTTPSWCSSRARVRAPSTISR